MVAIKNVTAMLQDIISNNCFNSINLVGLGLQLLSK